MFGLLFCLHDTCIDGDGKLRRKIIMFSSFQIRVVENHLIKFDVDIFYEIDYFVFILFV